MSHYKPYPAYKNSGIEWIGPVPEHWEVKRIKFVISTCRNGVWGDDPTGSDDTLCVRVADFDRNALRVNQEIPTLRAITEKDRVSRLLRRGNLLLEKSGGGEKQPVGQVVLYDHDAEAVCSNFIARIELVDQAEPSFWCYQFSGAYACGLNLRSVKQTSGIQNLDQEQYLDEVATYPPPSEQTAIAVALDRETARIDALIAKKTRFIELLKEKRQALITHAVTKGLDPKVKMKNSGVEWIGEVPEHWIVSQVKFVATIGNGSTPARDRPDYWEQGTYPWLTSSCVNQEQIGAAEEFVTSTAMSECHLPIIRPPAILVGITGQGRTRGMATTLSIEATINQHIAFLKANEARIQTPFLRRFIDVAYDWLRLDSEGAGSTKGAITCEQLGALPVLLPPAAEQERIITHVTGMTARTDSLAAKAERSIALLKERRSALITAAVTGQIDLRLSNANQP